MIADNVTQYVQSAWSLAARFEAIHIHSQHLKVKAYSFSTLFTLRGAKVLMHCFVCVTAQEQSDLDAAALSQFNVRRVALGL